MSTTINNYGVLFPNGSLQVTGGAFDSGTRTFFHQSVAPTGWTQVVDYDNRALRVTAGSVGTGGINGFTTAFGTLALSGSTDLTTIDITTMASHGHTGSDSGHTHPFAQYRNTDAGCGDGCSASGTSATTGAASAIVSVGSTGGGGGHAHGFSGVTVPINVSYVDIIVASKDVVTAVTGSTTMDNYGIVFPDGTTQYTAGAFPEGTETLFVQYPPPPGWTTNTSFDNYALRVVSGAVSNYSGNGFTTAFGNFNISGSTDGAILSTAQIPSHSHGGSSAGHTHPYAGTRGGPSGACGDNCANQAAATNTSTGYAQFTVSNTGSGLPHAHSFSGVSIPINVAYVDVIIARKDAA